MTEQGPHPPPVYPLADDLEATDNANAREILSAPSLLSLLASKQRKTLGGLPEGVRHPDADLLRNYVKKGIHAYTGTLWLPQALETAIYKGPHASACTSDMTAFIWGDMQQRIKEWVS